MGVLLATWLIAAAAVPAPVTAALPGGASLTVLPDGPAGEVAAEVVLAAGPWDEAWSERGLAELFTDPALQGPAPALPTGWRRTVRLLPRGMRVAGRGPPEQLVAFLEGEVSRLAGPGWSDALYAARADAYAEARTLAAPLCRPPRAWRVPTPVTARAWQRRWWVPGSLRVVVVGRVDAQALQAVLAARLGAWEAPRPPPRLGPPPPPSRRWVEAGSARALVLTWPGPWAARVPEEAAAWRLAVQHLFGEDGRVRGALAPLARVAWEGGRHPGPESRTRVVVWPRPEVSSAALEAALASALARGAEEALAPDRLAALVAREALPSGGQADPSARAAVLATFALEAGQAEAWRAWEATLASVPAAAVHAAAAAGLSRLPAPVAREPRR